MSIFSIGLSGLNAAQNALNTTSNNISNVYTPGYNRELTIVGEGKAGGVQVNDIQRQFNHYVANQLNAASSSSSGLRAYSTQISQIDNLLADREAGLAPLMQKFFSALEDLAGAPSDPAARQGVIGTADTLSAQFRSFDRYLQDMQEGINGQIRDEVTQINNATDQIGKLNREIALARARTGEAPNSLLNQRDQAVADLSERLNVRLTVQDGKTYNISLPNGQPLVSGTNTFKLEAMDSPSDPQRTIVGYRDSAGNSVALSESSIGSGTLGGLMAFRSETLDKAQNQIGQLAVTLTASFNEQHRLGRDLNNEQGADFFAIGQPVAYSDTRNNGRATVTAEFGDIADLRATDYTVRVSTDSGATTFEVVRKDNGTVLSGDQVVQEGNKLSFGGIVLTFDTSKHSLANGDRFEVQPVRRAGSGMQSQIQDLEKIAAGSFIQTSGDMQISGLEAANPALTSGNRTLALDSNGMLAESAGVLHNGNAVDPAKPIVAGDVLTVDGISFSVKTIPEGDSVVTLTLGQAASGSGDNRNALALQKLQDQLSVGGKASFNQAYAAMVSDVGNRTNIVKVNLSAQEGLTEQLKAVQQSESGVNLDEEAANLIRYQQYYQANARVIDIGSSILDTILGLRA
ncbi:flagellar hook-associated protein FlgK [Litchfieldella xinjiangensis]|uniref:flagellar hook-associated protein FlgK n=1 Tax=Litchfieldella xinjiangensis TaxID=1166948 RepID=UPI0005B78E6C|nr:flagellar hook-associated protein FlgK [Halomonas xinjiangensis]